MFRPNAKLSTENIQSISDDNIILPSRVKTELFDISSIQSEFDNASAMQQVIQETSTGRTMKIKSEYNENNSVASSSIEPISIKTENCFNPLKMPKKDDTKIVYKCCNMKFNDKFQHFQHMIYHTEETIRYSQFENIKCQYCDQYFKTENCMIRHLKSVHIGYDCFYCLRHFPKKQKLLKHLQVEHNKTRKYNHSYPQSNVWRWRKWNWSKHTQRVKNIKKEEDCTQDIKFTPDIANVKMELNPTNIKTEPLLNVKEEFIPTIKIESVYSLPVVKLEGS